MSKLPSLASSIFELTLPGINEKIKYRPFTIKEYKSILQAKDFGDEASMITTISEILKSCIQSDIDIDEYSMYYVDYIFLMIRTKSIGEVIEARYQCNHIVDKLDNKNSEGVPQDIIKDRCGNIIDVDIPLSETIIKFPKDYNAKTIIRLNDTVGLRLKVPSFNRYKSISAEDKKSLFDLSDEYLFSCIDCIFNGDEVLIPGKDFNLEELSSFIDSFPADIVKKIADFFRNQPFVHLSMKLKCRKCGNESTIELNGLDDFFD